MFFFNKRLKIIIRNAFMAQFSHSPTYSKMALSQAPYAKDMKEIYDAVFILKRGVSKQRLVLVEAAGKEIPVSRYRKDDLEFMIARYNLNCATLGGKISAWIPGKKNYILRAAISAKLTMIERLLKKADELKKQWDESEKAKVLLDTQGAKVESHEPPKPIVVIEPKAPEPINIEKLLVPVPNYTFEDSPKILDDDTSLWFKDENGILQFREVDYKNLNLNGCISEAQLPVDRLSMTVSANDLSKKLPAATMFEPKVNRRAAPCNRIEKQEISPAIG
jgi:hypothetical protein